MASGCGPRCAFSGALCACVAARQFPQSATRSPVSTVHFLRPTGSSATGDSRHFQCRYGATSDPRDASSRRAIAIAQSLIWIAAASGTAARRTCTRGGCPCKCRKNHYGLTVCSQVDRCTLFHFNTDTMPTVPPSYRTLSQGHSIQRTTHAPTDIPAMQPSYQFRPSAQAEHMMQFLIDNQNMMQ